MPPGTESWAERFGPIGVVAALALAALAFALKTFFSDRKEERTRAEREQADHDKLVADLHAKLVETQNERHRETLRLLADQQNAHEQRYQALLDRHMTETSRNAEALRAQSQSTAEALKGLVKRLKDGA